MVGIDLIDEHGAMLAAMPGQVPLSVTVDIESTHHARAFNRRLPDGSVNGPALPRDVARPANID
jgi:hypothetical protein